MMLEDFTDSAGVVKGHYFHKDLLVVGYIHAANPALNHDSIKLNLTLERFDYVDDLGDLKLRETVDGEANKVRYGCGIYTFRKTNSKAGG